MINTLGVMKFSGITIEVSLKGRQYDSFWEIGMREVSLSDHLSLRMKKHQSGFQSR